MKCIETVEEMIKHQSLTFEFLANTIEKSLQEYRKNKSLTNIQNQSKMK